MNIEKKTQSKPKTDQYFTKHKMMNSSDENIQTGESVESLTSKIA